MATKNGYHIFKEPIAKIPQSLGRKYKPIRKSFIHMTNTTKCSHVA